MQVLSYRSEELVGRCLRDVLVLPEDQKGAERRRKAAEQGEVVREEGLRLDRSGRPIPVEFIGARIPIPGFDHEEYLDCAFYFDLRERKALEEQLRQLAESDPLTGLYNRRAFSAAVQSILAHETEAWLIFIDLNGFKDINDRLGHLEGDRLLTTFSQRLRASLRSGDLVGRLGGDEFGILLVGAQEPLASWEARVQSALSDLGVSFSWGWAHAPEEGRTLEELLELADRRMYAHKKGAKSSS